MLDGAAWQRCRTHFMRNLLVKVPRHAQPMVASLVLWVPEIRLWVLSCKFV